MAEAVKRRGEKRTSRYVSCKHTWGQEEKRLATGYHDNRPGESASSQFVCLKDTHFLKKTTKKTLEIIQRLSVPSNPPAVVLWDVPAFPLSGTDGGPVTVPTYLRCPRTKGMKIKAKQENTDGDGSLEVQQEGGWESIVRGGPLG